jgi:hypothetical protein
VSRESSEVSTEAVAAQTWPIRGANHSFEDNIDLATREVSAPAGLLLHFEAADHDNVSGPNVGRAPEFILRVVTESELRADLLRRERELRREFAALVKQQAELVTESRVLAAAADPALLSGEHNESLLAGQKRQSLVGERTAVLAQRMDMVVLEILNNRLEEPGSPLPTRLAGAIAAPLRQLAEKEIPAAVQELAAARLAQSPAPRQQSLNAAIAQQQRIHSQMDDILAQLAQSEGFQEAVNLLYEIEQAQGQVHDETNKARQQRIQRILEGKDPLRP